MAQLRAAATQLLGLQLLHSERTRNHLGDVPGRRNPQPSRAVPRSTTSAAPWPTPTCSGTITLSAIFRPRACPDTSHTIVPTLHNFTYDVYFWGSNLQSAQALEFDVNQFFNNMGFTWGHECRTGGGNEWDIWDNANAKWVSTGIACNPSTNQWNHLTHPGPAHHRQQVAVSVDHVQRCDPRAEQDLSTVLGSGMVRNHRQLPADGNYKQSPYTVYVDKLNFTYQ